MIASPRVRGFGAPAARALDRLLPVWFIAWCLVRLYQVGTFPGSHLPGWDFSWFGNDFRIYRSAAVELLAGGSPLEAFAPWNGTNWHFAAPPTAAQAFVPFALVPEWVGLAIFALASIGVALLALRRLGLAWWWIFFPPIHEGLMALNPQVLVFGLLLVGGVPGRVVAALLKIYAVIPMVARREFRALAACAIALAISIALSPGAWVEYVRRYGEVSARLQAESQGGLSVLLFLQPNVMPLYAGLLLVGVVAGMVLLAAVRDVRSAGWLAVPLLWPAAEYHYATFAIPIARRPSTWILAIPTIPSYLVGLLLLTWEVTAGRPAIVKQEEPLGLAAWLRSLPGIGRAGTRPRGPGQASVDPATGTSSGGRFAATPEGMSGPKSGPLSEPAPTLVSGPDSGPGSGPATGAPGPDAGLASESSPAPARR